MRLDHFVLFNNHLTTTTKGDNMSKPLETPSITKSRGFGSCLGPWIETQNFDLVGTGKRIYGRIQDTGCNYIIEGINMNGDWVRIPCRRLIDAQILLAKVMSKEDFEHLKEVY